MRKIIVSMMVTLDGFFAGPHGEIDWHIVDEEFNEYANDLLSSVDTILFGRVTYQLMADYWPTPTAMTDDPIIAAKMNNLAKVVFSKTVNKLEWENSRLAKENIGEQISRMKKDVGKEMVIFGSSSIVSALTQLGLIDEYRIIVNPVILGTGKTLFKDIKGKVNLKLLKTKTFSSGNVLLIYQLSN